MVKDYRSKPKIYADILESVAEQGYARPTKIMMDANLSYDRLKKHLETLVQKGLLRHAGDTYSITEAGIEFLTEFKRFERFASAFGLRI